MKGMEISMRVCVMTPSKSQIIIFDEIEFNEERTVVDLIVKKIKVGELDLTKCELKKLNRQDNDMEYYEIVERNTSLSN